MIDELAVIELPAPVRDRMGLARGRLELQRAWPRSAEHVLLEFVGDQGRSVPGQWMKDPAKLERVARQTARQSPAAPTAVLEPQRVLLQSGGADRRLVGLRQLLSRSDATLLAHRPERRATVRLGCGTDSRFAKVVRPSQLPEVTSPPQHLAGLARRGFALPAVVETDEQGGIVTWARLAGSCMHDLLDQGDRLVRASHAAGVALRGLHGCPPPPTCGLHDAAAEIVMLATQLDRLRALQPAEREQLGDHHEILETLDEPSCGTVAVHRDFYDKQVFIDDEGRPGLLDFDTMARGEPALDVANMLVHLQLRAVQERCSNDSAEAAAEAFLDGYAPSKPVRQRLPAYQDATRLRLACLYAWRPRWRHLSRILLDMRCIGGSGGLSAAARCRPGGARRGDAAAVQG